MGKSTSPPMCRLCGEAHWMGKGCPKFNLSKAKVRVTEIAARPVTLGSKGKATVAARTGAQKTRATPTGTAKPKRRPPQAASASIAPDKPKPPKPAPEKVEP